MMQKKLNRVKCEDVSADKLVAGVKEMFESGSMSPKQTAFMADAEKLSGTELFGKRNPVTRKLKIITYTQKALLVTGLYGTVKKYVNRVRGR